MRTTRLVLATSLLVTPSWAAGADRDEASVRAELDAAIASVVGGGLASAADDATYLRRIWIDLAGHAPPALTAREFLDDPDPGKRPRMVARLLESDDFADHWGRVLTIWMTSERPIERDAYDGRVLHKYLRDRLIEKAPYDRVVRDLIVGSGSSDSSGPANFLLRHGVDPTRLAGAVGKNFLGVTIGCAQCHAHPFARWKEEDFWGLAASFARLRKLEGEDNLKAVVEARKGELTRPGPEGEPKPGEEAPKPAAIRPRLLDGRVITDRDRRAALAEWVVARDNPFFARNLVNRAWDDLFGKALVANLDDPAARPDSLPVLDLLARDFAGHGHDLRRLLRIVVLSRGYGQDSTSRARPAWARPAARPMTVDQLHASIAQATGYEGPAAQDEEDPGADDPGGPEIEAPPAIGEAEEELAGSDRPEEALGERALTLQRALVLFNGEFIREASRSAVRVSHALQGRRPDASRVEWACLATLSRRPTPQELGIFRGLLAEPGGLEDVYWVLLNSSEFQLIH